MGLVAAAGNLSMKAEVGWLMTPTGCALGRLDPARLSLLDDTGHHVSGDPPTKETFLHLGMYRRRPTATAVVHLHSTWSVAVSCLADIDPADVLPPITAYYVMRVGRLARCRCCGHFGRGQCLHVEAQRPDFLGNVASSISATCAARQRQCLICKIDLHI